MSDRTYRFEMFSDDSLRLINQAGVRQRIGMCGKDYRGCWDANLSPDGILYYAPSDESGAAPHTRLIAYDYQTDTPKVCFKADEVVLPRPRQLPVTKLHESLCFLPDGRVFGTTHSTAKAPQHPEWMPLAHHTHIWEGWPGSTMVCYDPKTGKTENWGVPAPRESIYGAAYDAKHNAIYMIGFLRGHIYRYSLDERKVVDLGKAAEIFCYRLYLGPDGHIYGCTKSGFLFRVNVDTVKIEDLNWRVPAYPGNYCNNTWYRYMSQARNVDERTMIFSTFCSDEFFSYDTVTQRVSPLGRKTTFDEFFGDYPTTMGVNEFDIDADGVLWYVIAVYSFQRPDREDRVYLLPDYLMRWDYRRGEEPECLGAVGTPPHLHGQTSAVKIDRKRDILYLVEGGSNPKGHSVTCVDLAQFRPVRHQPGPVATDPIFRPRPTTPAEREAIRKRGKATEETTASNPFYAFPIETITPVRLWRCVPHTAIEESKVIGLIWDADNVLHGICGEAQRWAFRIGTDGTVQSFGPLDDAPADYRQWLEASILPRPLSDEPVSDLPHVTGRQYLAKASADCAWNGGRRIVGTRDGLLALVSESGTFALGNAAPFGPVRSLCTNPDRTRLWGTAGDEEDLGTVFAYDDQRGLRQLGHLVFNIHGYFDGPSASNVLSAIAVSNDERHIAVGGADRLGAIHLAKLG